MRKSGGRAQGGTIMKKLTLCLSGVVLAFGVFVASSASATVLCATATEPCTSKYGLGTEIKAELASGTKWTLKAGFATAECGAASLVEKVTNAGGSGASVTASVSTRSATSCGSCTVATLKNGTTHYEAIAGSHDLTITDSGSEITVSCGGVECVYGTPSAVHVGVYTASDVKFDVQESEPKISGSLLCASTASLTATYKVTSPSPLYGAGS
jgi:hypothetical protein